MKKKKVRVLTFDGGGIRGVLTAQLLNRINQKYPGFYEQTYLYAGTSTGSFIALGLAYGKNPEEILELYRKSKVFEKKNNNPFTPKYSNDVLKKDLLSIFPEDLTLDQLKAKVVVPSFRLKTTGVPGEAWSPVFFNNLDLAQLSNESDDPDYLLECCCNLNKLLQQTDMGKERVIDVALRSSAAPTYLPAYDGHVDGGVIATNPALIALSLAMWGNVAPARAKLAMGEEKEICLLSLGTGFIPEKIDDASKWGLLQWGIGKNFDMPILNITINGVVEAYDMIAYQMLRERYWRLHPRLKENIGLDDQQKIERLIQIADEEDMCKTFRWVEKYWLD